MMKAGYFNICACTHTQIYIYNVCIAQKYINVLQRSADIKLNNMGVSLSGSKHGQARVSQFINKLQSCPHYISATTYTACTHYIQFHVY